MTPDDWTFGGIIGGITTLFGGVALQQRKHASTLQTSLEKANKALDEERESCGERLTLIETRMDKERDDCDRRHRELADDVDNLRRLMRRMTPRDFPAVKEPKP